MDDDCELEDVRDGGKRAERLEEGVSHRRAFHFGDRVSTAAGAALLIVTMVKRRRANDLPFSSERQGRFRAYHGREAGVDGGKERFDHRRLEQPPLCLPVRDGHLPTLGVGRSWLVMAIKVTAGRSRCRRRS